MKPLICLVLSILLLSVTPVDAGTRQGAKEIQLQGSFVNTSYSESDDTATTTTGQLSLNYFLTHWLSVGGTGRISGTKYDTEDDGSDATNTTTFLMLSADIYLGSGASALIPYIGARAGIANHTYESDGYDDTSSTTSYGGHGGLKVFPTENVSWNIEFDVTSYTPEADEGETENTTTNTSILLGFSYYF